MCREMGLVQTNIMVSTAWWAEGPIPVLYHVVSLHYLHQNMLHLLKVQFSDQSKLK